MLFSKASAYLAQNRYLLFLLFSFKLSVHIFIELMLIILYKQKNINKKMEKLVRYRKAFYEKENHLQNGNKKKDLPLPANQKAQISNKLYRSLSQSLLPKAVLPKKDKIKSNTEIFCQNYGQQLLNLPCYQLKSPHFLRRHQVDNILRARMLDWMVEVTSSYKFTNKTYFDGISIMDRFFEAEREAIVPTKLHVIGVQCMLIASKMNEVYPLKIKTVFQKIGHKKLPLDQLVQVEENIIKVLNYKLNSWTFFDLALMKMAQLVSRDEDQRQSLGELLMSYNSTAKVGDRHEGKESQLKNMEDICSYISKFAFYDYEFYCDNSAILLAESVIKATFEILEITPPITFFTCSQISIQLCKQKLFKLIQIHKSKFQSLGNLFKFTRKDIIVKVEQFL